MANFHGGPAKKPRLESNCQPPASSSNPDDLWDDELGFTGEQLDILESQAFTQAAQEEQFTSHKKPGNVTKSRNKCLPSSAEKLNSSLISLSDFYAPVQCQNKLYNCKPSQYSPINSSIPSLSGLARDLAPTNEGHQSANVNKQPNTRLSSQSDTIKINVPKEYDSSKKLLQKQEEELEKYKTKLKKLQEDNYANVGEVKILRDAVNQKEQEIKNERQQRLLMIEKLKQERKEAALEYENEINSLKTELQFKSQELIEMQSKYSISEMKRKKATSTSLNSENMFHDTPRSKQLTSRINVNGVSPKKAKTFISCENVDWTINSPTTSNASIQTDVGKPKVPVYSLTLKNPRGKLAGPKIISNLIQNNVKKNNLFNTGLTSVIHSMEQLNVDLLNSKPISCQSPIPALEEISNRLSYSQFQALNGVYSLLGNNSGEEKKLETSILSLLPIINESMRSYISLFLDLKSSITEKAMANASGILEETFTQTQTLQLCKAKLVSSNWLHVERTLLSSLKILSKLLFLCPQISNRILSGEYCLDWNVKEFLQSDWSSSILKLDETSSSASLFRSLSSLIQLLILLDADAINNEVLEHALHVVCVLVTTAKKSLLSPLRKFLLPNILGKLLHIHSDFEILISTLQTAKFLLSQTDAASVLLENHEASMCPLRLLGKLSQNVFIEFPHSKASIMMQEIIDFLMILISKHGISVFLHEVGDNSCFSELSFGIIQSLNEVLNFYDVMHSDIELNLIRSTFMLLYELSTLDSHFHQHRSPVQRRYILIINKIGRLYKQVKGQLTKKEVIAIQELNEFSSDDLDEYSSE